MALATILIFGGLGVWLIPLAREVDISQFLAGHKPMYLQCLVGLVVGFTSAMAGWQIVELPFLHGAKMFFVNIIRPLKLNILEIVFISVCAGVGEELFFRGALQPYLGIWFTAFLFVLLHGYISLTNLPLTLYGLYMVLVIGVLGLFVEHVGIVTAMIGHTVIDVILIYRLSKAEISNEDADSNE